MLTLEQSFNNIKLVCDGVVTPGLDNAQRQAVNESLNNIADALQAHKLMLQAVKDKESEKLEDETNEKEKL